MTAIRLTKLLWAKSIQERNIDNIVSLAQSIYETIAQHSQTLFEMKNLLNESAQKFNREYEKIASNNKFFKAVNALKSYGIETTTKKTGRKTNEVTINQDFLE